MTPLLAPPCGAPNPALCLRVSNTEQATLLLVCRARREGPERCGHSDVPAPRPGQRDHGPPHVPRVPERAAHPRPQLRASRGRPARPSASSGTVPGTTSEHSSLCCGRHAPRPRGAGGCARAAVCCPCTRAWPRWRPTQPPSDSSEARGEVGPGWGGFASLSAGSRPQEPAPCSAAG